MTVEHPKLFISYSWTTSSHEEWVLELATELRESGVDVILDKWDLKEGQDSNVFMEKMVTDPNISKVVMICDRVYAQKTDERSGGVGTEAQIISPEIYNKQEQTKFVAVLPEKDEDGKPFLPTYYKPRIYIDLSNPELYSNNFEQLLRWIYDKPLYKKPDFGDAPSFLSEDDTLSLATSGKFRLAFDAIRNDRKNCHGTITEYFETFAENLEAFRIIKDSEEFDDKVVKNIEQFLPYRNEAIEIIKSIAIYRATEQSWDSVHKFFERLIVYTIRPENITSYQDLDIDNFRFIIHELFLYVIAVLTKSECYDGISKLLNEYYYIPKYPGYEENPMFPFTVIRINLKSLNYRNQRLEMNRLSIHSDLLETRAKQSALSFKEIMQADFLLYIRDSLDCMRLGRKQRWWPETLLYADRLYGPFEIFAKSQSKKYFDKLKQVLKIEKVDELYVLDEAFQTKKLWTPYWGHISISPLQLMGFSKIGSLD